MQEIKLPETGFLRVKQIVGDKKKDIPALIPIGRSTFLQGVKKGKYPASIKLSAGVTVWRVEDIRNLINEFSQTA